MEEANSDGQTQALHGYNSSAPRSLVVNSNDKTFVHDNIYQMVAGPRGQILIINNANSEAASNGRNELAHADGERVMQTFKDLGFSPYKRDQFFDLGRRQMEKLLRKFANSKLHNNSDACVVVFLAHGFRDGVYGVDGWKIAFEDIVKILGESEVLYKKPKIVIFDGMHGGGYADRGVSPPSTVTTEELQYPQYPRRDTGVHAANLDNLGDASQSSYRHNVGTRNNGVTFVDSKLERPENDIHYITHNRHNHGSAAGVAQPLAAGADMIFIYNSMHPYRAVHAKDARFIQVLCDTIEQNAAKLDLLTILTIANRRLGSQPTSSHANEFQQSCFTSSLHKILYFNPGYFERVPPMNDDSDISIDTASYVSHSRQLSPRTPRRELAVSPPPELRSLPQNYQQDLYAASAQRKPENSTTFTYVETHEGKTNPKTITQTVVEETVISSPLVDQNSLQQATPTSGPPAKTILSGRSSSSSSASSIALTDDENGNKNTQRTKLNRRKKRHDDSKNASREQKNILEQTTQVNKSRSRFEDTGFNSDVDNYRQTLPANVNPLPDRTKTKVERRHSDTGVGDQQLNDSAKLKKKKKRGFLARLRDFAGFKKSSKKAPTSTFNPNQDENNLTQQKLSTTTEQVSSDYPYWIHSTPEPARKNQGHHSAEATTPAPAAATRITTKNENLSVNNNLDENSKEKGVETKESSVPLVSVYNVEEEQTIDETKPYSFVRSNQPHQEDIQRQSTSSPLDRERGESRNEQEVTVSNAGGIHQTPVDYSTKTYVETEYPQQTANAHNITPGYSEPVKEFERISITTYTTTVADHPHQAKIVENDENRAHSPADLGSARAARSKQPSNSSSYYSDADADAYESTRDIANQIMHDTVPAEEPRYIHNIYEEPAEMVGPTSLVRLDSGRRTPVEKQYVESTKTFQIVKSPSAVASPSSNTAFSFNQKMRPTATPPSSPVGQSTFYTPENFEASNTTYPQDKTLAAARDSDATPNKSLLARLKEAVSNSDSDRQTFPEQEKNQSSPDYRNSSLYDKTEVESIVDERSATTAANASPLLFGHDAGPSSQSPVNFDREHQPTFGSFENLNSSDNVQQKSTTVKSDALNEKIIIEPDALYSEHTPSGEASNLTFRSQQLPIERNRSSTNDSSSSSSSYSSVSSDHENKASKQSPKTGWFDKFGSSNNKQADELQVRSVTVAEVPNASGKWPETYASESVEGRTTPTGRLAYGTAVRSNSPDVNKNYADVSDDFEHATKSEMIEETENRPHTESVLNPVPTHVSTTAVKDELFEVKDVEVDVQQLTSEVKAASRNPSGSSTTRIDQSIYVSPNDKFRTKSPTTPSPLAVHDNRIYTTTVQQRASSPAITDEIQSKTGTANKIKALFLGRNSPSARSVEDEVSIDQRRTIEIERSESLVQAMSSNNNDFNISGSAYEAENQNNDVNWHKQTDTESPNTFTEIGWKSEVLPPYREPSYTSENEGSLISANKPLPASNVTVESLQEVITKQKVPAENEYDHSAPLVYQSRETSQNNFVDDNRNTAPQRSQDEKQQYLVDSDYDKHSDNTETGLNNSENWSYEPATSHHYNEERGKFVSGTKQYGQPNENFPLKIGFVESRNIAEQSETEEYDAGSFTNLRHIEPEVRQSTEPDEFVGSRRVPNLIDHYEKRANASREDAVTQYYPNRRTNPRPVSPNSQAHYIVQTTETHRNLTFEQPIHNQPATRYPNINQYRASDDEQTDFANNAQVNNDSGYHRQQL